MPAPRIERPGAVTTPLHMTVAPRTALTLAASLFAIWLGSALKPPSPQPNVD
jgi:hypothetical protein